MFFFNLNIWGAKGNNKKEKRHIEFRIMAFPVGSKLLL